jgi:hypothetical protein
MHEWRLIDKLAVETDEWERAGVMNWTMMMVTN